MQPTTKNTPKLAALTQEQKEALGLLSIGTFLEYFDLMLYVHMAVLLNELFFPKTNPHTASLLTAFSFCSTYVLRPFGALLFGYIGDTIGRKATVIITTFVMAASCFIMANLPTYAQIGITASWVVTLCRIAQGMASMGEIIGAELYMTEITSPPLQYPAVTLISVFSILGTNLALGMASLTTSTGFNWRIAFGIGTVIAVIGSVARTKLRETPEFVDARRRIRKEVEEGRKFVEELDYIPAYHDKVSIKTSFALFLIQCGWPSCFYFTYIHCGSILKNVFGFNPEQVIRQNFIVSIINLLGYVALTYLSYRIHPLKILKTKAILFGIFILMSPYLFLSLQTPLGILCMQAFVMLFVLSCTSAMPIFLKHFPVFRRFTQASLIHALSRAIMSITTSFGLVYLVEIFGNWGVLMIMLPVTLGFLFGIQHFERLEKQIDNYPNNPNIKRIFTSSQVDAIIV